MNLIEISNVFNTIARAHSGISSYHMGWPSDRVRNVSNNFDDADIGQYFPRVLFWPPDDCTMTIAGNPLRDEMNITLIFDDLFGYDETGAQDNATQVEKWNALRLAAMQFVREVNKKGHDRIKENQDGFRIIGDQVQYMFDAPGGQQRLISVVVKFRITTTLECNDLSIDYDNLPEGWTWPVSASADLENTLD